MELLVWKGEILLGVPSMDLESLQMMLYVKFSHAPVEIKYCGSPYDAPNKKLPAFICSQGVLSDFSSMTEYLRKENYSCDHDLSPKQCADVVAYTQLLKEKLHPALLYLWWMESKNHSIINGWFYNKVTFPSKLWVSTILMKKNQAYLDCLFGHIADKLEVQSQIIKGAQECLTMLSHKLKDSDYFFGKNPTTIDALLIGYLTLFSKVDLETRVLQSHVKNCSNLDRYTNVVVRKFFPPTEQHKNEKVVLEKRSIERPPSNMRKYLICLSAVISANFLYLYQFS